MSQLKIEKLVEIRDAARELRGLQKVLADRKAAYDAALRLGSLDDVATTRGAHLEAVSDASDAKAALQRLIDDLAGGDL